MADLESDAELQEQRRQRFLARVLSEALTQGWSSAAQFIDWFPPSSLLGALAAEPQLRIRLLHELVGLPERVAASRSPMAAAEELQSALEEGRLAPEKLLEHLPVGLAVKYLDGSALWKFATGGQWLISASIDPSARPLAWERLSRVLAAAIGEELVTLVDLTTNVPLGELSSHASPDQLRGVFQYALWCAESRSVPDPERLLELINAAEIFSNWPIEHTWRRIIIEQIAVPCGIESLTPPRKGRDSHLRLKPPVPPVRLHTGMGAIEKADEALLAMDGPTLEQAPIAAEAAGLRVKEPVRRSAIESRLRKIDRLPPNHRYLSVAILKSIAQMYDEIKKHRGKQARAQCVKACFANDAHLRAGLLALVELLDPSSSSLLADSDSDELIDALLMQERAIWQRARSRRMAHPASAHTGAAPRGVPAPMSGLTGAGYDVDGASAELVREIDESSVDGLSGRLAGASEEEPSNPSWKL